VGLGGKSSPRMRFGLNGEPFGGLDRQPNGGGEWDRCGLHAQGGSMFTSHEPAEQMRIAPSVGRATKLWCGAEKARKQRAVRSIVVYPC